MEAVECSLLRSDRGVKGLMNVFNVSLRCTFTLPRTMQCSFLFQFVLAPVIAAVVSRLFCVEFFAVAVLEAVGVAIHDVDGSSSPDDQMSYTSLWRVCQRYTMSCE